DLALLPAARRQLDDDGAVGGGRLGRLGDGGRRGDRRRRQGHERQRVGVGFVLDVVEVLGGRRRRLGGGDLGHDLGEHGTLARQLLGQGPRGAHAHAVVELLAALVAGTGRVVRVGDDANVFVGDLVRLLVLVLPAVVFAVLRARGRGLVRLGLGVALAVVITVSIVLLIVLLGEHGQRHAADGPRGGPDPAARLPGGPPDDDHHLVHPDGAHQEQRNEQCGGRRQRRARS